MKAMKSLVVAALSAGGLAVAADAQAGRGGHSGGGHSGHGHAGAGHSGFHGGGWGGRGSWGGHRFFSGPRIGVFIGAPLLFSPWYGGPSYYYDDYYYPPIVDRMIEPYSASYPEGAMEWAPPDPRTELAPPLAPAYMNYCESGDAYFPRVTTCPEGWKFVPVR